MANYMVYLHDTRGKIVDSVLVETEKREDAIGLIRNGLLITAEEFIIHHKKE